MRIHRSILLALLSLSMADAARAAEAPGADPRVGAAIDAVAARFRDVPVTGMTIAVSRDGRVVHLAGYGLADIGTGAAADAETVYEIGSITKTVTAAAVLRLVEQGRLGLEDPVTDHFPALAAIAQGATVRHLLAHTSGLFSGPNTPDPTRAMDPASVIATIAAAPVEFAPGSRYRYNNNGYFLLGLLVERLTGEPYGEAVAEAFFRPLGMDHTGVCPTPRAAGTATGYEHPTRGDPAPRPHPIHHPSASYAAGSVCSTAGDMLVWLDALAGGRVVSPASWTLMTTPQPLADNRASPYGLGVFSDDRSGERHLHHGGAASGFISQVGRYPADGLSVVVLTNGIYSGAIVEQIEAAVVRAARGLPDAGPERRPLSADDRARFAGTYQVGPVRVDVFEQGEDLRAQPAGQVAARLLHQGDGVFLAEHDPGLRLSFGPAEGRAETLILSQGDRALPAGRRVAGEPAAAGE